MEAGDREDFHRLKDISVSKQRELVTEQALYDVGLSSVPRLGLFFFSFFFGVDPLLKLQTCCRG